MLRPDTCEGDSDLPQYNVSYKPQKISPKFEGTVRQLLHKKIRDSYLHPQFVSDVMKPMTIEPLMDQEVQHLSGGELQVRGRLRGSQRGWGVRAARAGGRAAAG
jgi:ATP-binding cassette subfamily E protein 1